MVKNIRMSLHKVTCDRKGRSHRSERFYFRRARRIRHVIVGLCASDRITPADVATLEARIAAKNQGAAQASQSSCSVAGASEAPFQSDEAAFAPQVPKSWFATVLMFRLHLWQDHLDGLGLWTTKSGRAAKVLLHWARDDQVPPVFKVRLMFQRSEKQDLPRNRWISASTCAGTDYCVAGKQSRITGNCAWR